MRIAVPTPEERALRSEHDALAMRLSARSSIDDMRRGFYALFSALILGGISAKLAYDRWGPYHPRAFKGPPIYFFLALGAGLAGLAFATICFVRGRRRMRAEESEFARLKALRGKLGLSP